MALHVIRRDAPFLVALGARADKGGSLAGDGLLGF